MADDWQNRARLAREEQRRREQFADNARMDRERRARAQEETRRHDKWVKDMTTPSQPSYTPTRNTGRGSAQPYPPSVTSSGGDGTAGYKQPGVTDAIWSIGAFLAACFVAFAIGRAIYVQPDEPLWMVLGVGGGCGFVAFRILVSDQFKTAAFALIKLALVLGIVVGIVMYLSQK